MSRLLSAVCSAVLCAFVFTGCATRPAPPAAPPSASPASSLSDSPIRDEFGTRQDMLTASWARCFREAEQRGEVERCSGAIVLLDALGRDMRDRIRLLPNATEYRQVVSKLDAFLVASDGYRNAGCGSGYEAGSAPCPGLYTDLAVSWTGMGVELLQVEGTHN